MADAVGTMIAEQATSAASVPTHLRVRFDVIAPPFPLYDLAFPLWRIDGALEEP